MHAQEYFSKVSRGVPVAEHELTLVRMSSISDYFVLIFTTWIASRA
jgi:hypothetical protein